MQPNIYKHDVIFISDDEDIIHVNNTLLSSISVQLSNIRYS